MLPDSDEPQKQLNKSYLKALLIDQALAVSNQTCGTTKICDCTKFGIRQNIYESVICGKAFEINSAEESATMKPI